MLENTKRGYVVFAGTNTSIHEIILLSKSLGMELIAVPDQKEETSFEDSIDEAVRALAAKQGIEEPPARRPIGIDRYCRPLDVEEPTLNVKWIGTNSKPKAKPNPNPRTATIAFNLPLPIRALEHYITQRIHPP